MTVTLCTSGDAVIKAGPHVNLTMTDAQWTSLINMAEGSIGAKTGVDWVAGFGTISGTTIVTCLKDICSSMVAMAACSRDSTGYLPREADMIMNYNDEVITKGFTDLKSIKSVSNIKLPTT